VGDTELKLMICVPCRYTTINVCCVAMRFLGLAFTIVKYCIRIDASAIRGEFEMGDYAFTKDVL
jgi:hypothetical protein